MRIRLYNSMTRQKEDFEPLNPDNVRMYVCGPTVYDRAHLGNARPVVVFDVLYRLLQHTYGADHVTYARNFTDVDDKINARAAESGCAIGDITAETTQWFLDDMGALGALEPDHMPRATGYIAEMIAMIEALIDQDLAYAAEGHVLFRVRAYKEYGALSGRSVDDMIAGARVEIAPFKEDPMDFVLWKPSDAATPGWDSPWGRGRPGWHIECSAMSHALLGEQFDIHGGGLDLQFPHHENEIAQSCAQGHGFARYWMHNEMLQVEGKKMSKSLGNFFTVRDLLDRYDDDFGIENVGPAIRLRFLQSHYRSPVDAATRYIEQAAVKLEGWWHSIETFIEDENRPQFQERTELLANSDFIQAISDDLNTPLAVSIIDQLIQKISIPVGDGEIQNEHFDNYFSIARRALVYIEFLGFDFDTLENFTSDRRQLRLKRAKTSDSEVNELIERLLIKRSMARENKDYSLADQIRDGLNDAGIILIDKPEGVTWEISPTFDLSKLERLL